MKKNAYSIKIIISLFVFFVISLLSVYSAKSISSESLGNIFFKQSIFYLVGVIVLLIGFFYKRVVVKYSYLWYLGFVFLLFVLLFLGTSINGSRCWLILGPISFQPSEFMKIALILAIATVLEKYKYKNRFNFKREAGMLFKVFLLLLIPSVLTFLEPDTGVVIIYFIITIGMILYRGINKKWYILVMVILTLLGGGITYLYVFQHDFLIELLGSSLFYRIDRLLNWSNQSGYQLENSLVAIGSSGLFGFGFNNNLLYFPEASTDFIFTTFSSNFGFIGSVILIIFIILFDISIVNLCKKKVKKYNEYILIGIFCMILYQQVQNISMTIGLLPITGITLPFISYGGSSLISYMFITGIVLRISYDSRHYLN